MPSDSSKNQTALSFDIPDDFQFGDEPSDMDGSDRTDGMAEEESRDYDPYYGDWEPPAAPGEAAEESEEQPSLMLTAEQVISNMNPEQAAAISLPVDGAAMVLAGAGTGKTAVLTRRIAWLCANKINPMTVMAVTFTNKASKEMKERLSRLGVKPAPMMGTFHSIGLRILKLCPEAAGVGYGFTVMNEDDTKSLWGRLFIAKKGATPDYDNKQLVYKDPDIDIYRKGMFALKEEGVRFASDYQIKDTDPYYIKWLLDMLDIYENARREQNMVDFSDLISGSLVAITEVEAGKKWAKKFTHLLVDEFQDTSSLQYEWIKAMMSDRQNIFCVGDDNQSIYSFRGAQVGNIGEFVGEYNAKEVMLEQNYRCGTDILDAANKLIANNPNGGKKKLWAESDTGTIDFREFDKEHDESKWIAGQIKASGEFRESGHAAVLLRTRAAMLPVVSALRSHGINYHVVGAKDFFDRREIRDAMSLVRVAVNPSDYLSFVRAASIFDGVGKTTIEKIVTHCQSRGLAPKIGCREAKSDKVRAIWEVFGEITRSSSSSDSIKLLVTKSGLKKQCDEDDDAARAANITEFVEMAGGYKTIGQFLEEITLFAEKNGKEDGVTVSTIHAAKGLEWKSVFLPALSAGHIPSVRERDDIAKISAELEEERRLMYVAITRAKDNLFTSCAKLRTINGKPTECERSEFVAESGLDAHSRDESEDYAVMAP